VWGPRRCTHCARTPAWRGYRNYLDAYVLPVVGSTPLRELDTVRLNLLDVHLLEQGRMRVDRNALMFAYYRAEVGAGRTPTAKAVAAAGGLTYDAKGARCGVECRFAQRLGEGDQRGGRDARRCGLDRWPAVERAVRSDHRPALEAAGAHPAVAAPQRLLLPALDGKV
jgi:hypothetical protein